MKLILLLALFYSASAWAHEAHDHAAHAGLKSDKAIPGASVFQLDSKWTDIEGKSLLLKDLAGKPRLVTMLYTRCKTACPLIIDEIQRILNELPDKGKTYEVSLFSFDSEQENSQTMREFLKMRNLGPNWKVYRSNSNAVAELAAALGVRYKKLKNGEYIHSNSIYLLNSEGIVIGQKDGLNSKDPAFTKEVKESRRE